MFEALAKNLWLMLTLVIPGLFTYGTWRLFILLESGTSITTASMAQFDGSGIATASIIVSIALLQQALAIAVESLLTVLSKITVSIWPNFYSLFNERFQLTASGKLDDNATRIIANFFQSLNVSIGLVFVLVYFLLYESLSLTNWVPQVLSGLLAATVITTLFRLANAVSIMEEYRS